ncbi:MAG TPA: dipeptidase [Actinomycetota bacterium]|nr:dipeptidase [Actinomycetota bacterium]
MTDVEALRAAIRSSMPAIRTDLERLVRIPSVSARGFDPAAVARSADAVRDVLAASGFDARVLEVERGHPAVLGTIPAPPGAPTVLLYAHHDVQPPGPDDLWATPPFEPTERDGRLYGRGTADDKAGVAVHAAAVRAFGGRPPVGVTVFIEGEEEAGSENLAGFLSTYRDELRADALILADVANWRVGQPSLTVSLRGVAGCSIEVRTLHHAVHSGMYGGPLPDAITVLARTLATLHDEHGTVAVPGLRSGEADPLDLSDEELRRDAGAVDGLRLMGEGTLTGRLWTKPAVSVLAVDAPSIEDASNQIVPVARAVVSLRVAPGEDPDLALAALMDHLRSNVPWGAEVTLTPLGAGAPFQVNADGPAYDAIRRAFRDAFDVESVDIGSGGSIPFLSAFADAFPGAALLLLGVEDPASNAHSENESLHLGDFEKACLSEALFLAYFGLESTNGGRTISASPRRPRTSTSTRSPMENRSRGDT